MSPVKPIFLGCGCIKSESGMCVWKNIGHVYQNIYFYFLYLHSSDELPICNKQVRSSSLVPRSPDPTQIKNLGWRSEKNLISLTIALGSNQTEKMAGRRFGTSFMEVSTTQTGFALFYAINN